MSVLVVVLLGLVSLLMEVGSTGFELTPGTSNDNEPLCKVSKNCNSSLWRSRSTCDCGVRLNGIVMCQEKFTQIGILQCYCIFNDSSHNLMVGPCFYGCFSRPNLYTYYKTYNDLDKPCREGDRTGPLCGECNNNTENGVPAYSFSLKCRHCVPSWRNVVKYLAAAYGPLTIFFVIIVVLTVSVNSAPLHGYIFVAQMIATSTALRLLQTLTEVNQPRSSQQVPVSFAAIVYGFWNLDFFRFANHHYCLHPSLPTLTVMSLDYLIAAYPLVIIAIVYTLTVCHGRGCSALVIIWRPFNRFFARFRRRLDIRTSIVDAFGTFFNLSFVKFLSTTVDLMTVSQTWDTHGNPQHYRVYYDGRLHFMRGGHLPYAFVALFCFSVFNLFPILFLLLYPRQSFQRRLSIGLKRIIHPFMDTLLGIYRDGTEGGYDCRFFVVVYPIARIAILCMFMMAPNSFCFLLITAVTTFTAMLVAVLKPYKSAAYNTVDTILVTNLALIYASLSAFFFANAISTQQLRFARNLLITFAPLPFLYACGLTVYKTWKMCRFQGALVQVLQFFSYLSGKLKRKREMQTFPDERTQLIPRNNR